MAYDARSITPNRELPTATITSLVYLKKGAKTKSGAVYHYILSEDTVDCIGPQFQPKSRLVFDAAGKLVDAGDASPNTGWGPAPPNSPLGAFRSVACAGATFDGAIQAPNFAAAIKTMKELK